MDQCRSKFEALEDVVIPMKTKLCDANLIVQVRVLLENVGLTVTGLKRVRIGGYRLPQDMAIGEYREIKHQLVKRVIDKSVELNPEANPTTFR